MWKTCRNAFRASLRHAPEGRVERGKDFPPLGKNFPHTVAVFLEMPRIPGLKHGFPAHGRDSTNVENDVENVENGR